MMSQQSQQPRRMPIPSGPVLAVRWRAAATLAATTLVGLVAFLWPFLAKPGSGLAHSTDAPWLFVLLIALLTALVMAELSGGGMDAKTVAVLGVLAAAGQLGHDQCGQQSDEQHEQPWRVCTVRQTRSGLCQEGPQKGGQPHQGGPCQRDRCPPGNGEDGLVRELGAGAGHEASSAAATSATVSQGCGCITLATWGAKAGEPASTAAAGPSVTTSPSAMTMTLSASSATSSTSWVATRTPW